MGVRNSVQAYSGVNNSGLSQNVEYMTYFAYSQ